MGVSSGGVRGQAGHFAGKAEMHGEAGRGADRIGGQVQRQQIRKQSKRTSAQMSGLSVFLLIAIALEKKSPGYRVPGIFVRHHFAGFVSA